MTPRNIRSVVLIAVVFGLALAAVLVRDFNVLGLERRGFQLGLDLRGGSHLVFETVKTSFTVTFEQSVSQEQLQSALADLGHPDAVVQPRGDNTFFVQTVQSGLDEATAKEALESRLGPLTFGDFSVIPPPTDTQMEGALAAIRRRVDAFGVTEPVIQRMGEDRVLVQLPGVTDVGEAEALIGRTARLEFKERICNDGAACTDYEDRDLGLTGENLADAFPQVDNQLGFPVISLRFDSQGARIFAEVTTRIAGREDRRIAVFLDDQELLAPTVNQPILSGAAVIYRNNPPFTFEQVRQIGIQLQSGRLPVPLQAIERRSVEATLGQASLDKSLIAGAIGAAIVMLFMVLYYRTLGAVASVALVLYLVLVLALFKLIPVTLTLAGIAAFILSIGMAVDANILIFERMREELRAGRTMLAAVETGFNRAWPAIRDSNVSTFIICAVLWWFGGRLGASLVQGFAVTLFIGVAASMFTAIVVTKVLLRLIMYTPLGDHVALFLPQARRPAAGGLGRRG